MATYNRYNQPNSMYEFGKGNIGRNFGNKLLRKLSNFGMDDQEMVVKNSQAIGACRAQTESVIGINKERGCLWQQFKFKTYDRDCLGQVQI